MTKKKFRDLWDAALRSNGLEQDKSGVKVIQDRDFIRPIINTIPIQELAARRQEHERYSAKYAVGEDAGYPCPSCDGVMVIRGLTNKNAFVECSGCGYEEKRSAS